MQKIQLLVLNEVPSDLRNEYINTLPEPQEYFLEQLVQAGKIFLVETESQKTIGYLVLNGSTVVELFINSGNEGYIPFILTQAAQNLAARTILVKSFDPLYAYLEEFSLGGRETVGLLFRGYSTDPIKIFSELCINNLSVSEIEEVMSINDGFFDDESEVHKYILSKSVFSYRNNEGELLGCGILSRVIEGREAVDIGMLVSLPHRNQGWGTHVARHLKHICLERGDRPIAGCDIENVASRKALEAAGLRTQHQLFEYSLHGRD